VAGLPRDRALRVVGERMPAGDYEDRWRWVAVECRPGAAVARSEPAGPAGGATAAPVTVAVYNARLLLADADALGHWEHHAPLDGLADYVFWGPDAEAAARATGAGNLCDGDWGWTDLPLEEALARAEAVERLQGENRWRLEGDFRPHSHHHFVMEQVRASATESGVITVGGARLCAFLTTWGDGCYPVWRDLDAGGRLVRVRIDLGNDQAVERQRYLEARCGGEWARHALVSRRVCRDGAPVRVLYRKEPGSPADSGWVILAGDEPEAYVANDRNLEVMPLHAVLGLAPELEDLLQSPPGSAFRRADTGESFVEE
jgi:hypothetical protein